MHIMSPTIKFRAISIFFLACFCILIYLGTWQLHRAREKKDIIIQMQARIDSEPVMLSSIINPQLTTHRFTPTVVNGIYMNKYTFLVDNQIFNKHAGYRVITAVQTLDLDKWVLIDRGWIARDKDRQKIPKIHDVYGVRKFVGIINTIPSGIVLKEDQYKSDSNWPIIIQRLDFEFMAQSLQHNIYNFVIQLEPTDQTAYSTSNMVNLGMSSNMHLGYAVQWYLFACLTIIYYWYVFIHPKWQKL